MKDYVGKIVFLESIKPDKSYYNGEYIVVKQSPNNLYCVKPVVGYGSHELKIMDLVGADAYTVLTEYEDDKLIMSVIEGNEKFAAEKNSTGRTWCEGVYIGAAEVARQLRNMMEKKKAEQMKMYPETMFVKPVKITYADWAAPLKPVICKRCHDEELLRKDAELLTEVIIRMIRHSHACAAPRE